MTFLCTFTNLNANFQNVNRSSLVHQHHVALTRVRDMTCVNSSNGSVMEVKKNKTDTESVAESFVDLCFQRRTDRQTENPHRLDCRCCTCPLLAVRSHRGRGIQCIFLNDQSPANNILYPLNDLNRSQKTLSNFLRGLNRRRC